MQAPRTLAAAFLSAAIILTSGVALAEKGGKHHGGNGAAGSAASTSSNPDAKHDDGIGGMNHSANTPGSAGGAHTDIDHHFNNAGPDVFKKHESDSTKTDLDADTQFRFHGDVSAMDAKSAKLELKMRDGSKRQFDMDTAVANDLKTRKDTSNLVFFSVDGKRITGCAKIGETDHAKVTGLNNDSIVIQTQNGETRLLSMDDKSIKRLHLHAGSDVSVTTGGPQGGRIIAMDMLKKHWSDKFSGKHAGRDTRVASADRGGKTSKVKAKSKDRDTSDRDLADADANGGDKAKVGCGGGKGASGHGRAFANQMAKDAANDASGHNPPGLPHECVNPAGHVRGFCKSGGSDSACGSGGSGVVAGADVDTSAHKAKSKDRDSNKDVADVDANGGDKAKVGCGGGKGASGHGRAFANQMAKDAANDASGHNPPGLPHECVNPAGHVRGFCKSGGSDSSCGSGAGVVAAADVDTNSGHAKTHQAKSKDHDSDKDVADVDANGSDKTKIGCAGSKAGAGHGRAYANQMAKDAANDASGHNPPGLPHECVNPAGHVRGFCKSGGSGAACGGSGSVGGGEVAAVHTSTGPSARAAAPSTAMAPGTATAPGNAVAPVNSGTVVAAAPAARTPGMGASGPVWGPGMAPIVHGSSAGPAAAGSSAAPVAGISGGPVAMAAKKRAGHPTRVMGAAVGPTSGQIRLVRPMANTPCVWRKTAVAAASYHRYRVVGTSYTRTHHPMHRTACH